jgi:hypothetical protein
MIHIWEEPTLPDRVDFDMTAFMSNATVVSAFKLEVGG